MHRPGHFRPFTDFLNQGMRRTNNVARSSNLNPNQPGYVQPPGFNPAPGFNPVEEGGTNTIPGEIVIPGYNPPVPIKPFLKENMNTGTTQAFPGYNPLAPDFDKPQLLDKFIKGLGIQAEQPFGPLKQYPDKPLLKPDNNFQLKPNQNVFKPGEKESFMNTSQQFIQPKPFYDIGKVLKPTDSLKPDDGLEEFIPPAPTQPSFNFPDFNQPVFNDPSSVVPNFNFFNIPVSQPGPEQGGSNTIPGNIVTEDMNIVDVPSEPNVNFPLSPDVFTGADIDNSGALSSAEVISFMTTNQDSDQFINAYISALQELTPAGGSFTEDVPLSDLLSIYYASEAPEFTGGGGMGGQLARQLYYPSTTGGFASAGSGITGGQSNLQSLLNQLGR